MRDGEGERKVLQDKMNNLERDLDGATHENLKLKGLNFDLDYRINYYNMVTESLNKKVKLMSEKQSRMLKDIDLNQSNQDKEFKRVISEFELAKKDLDKIKKENLGKLDDLKRLQGDNVRVHDENYEEKVEEMERQLREADGVRKALQQRLEYSNLNWECKLRVFAKDAEDRNRQNGDSLKRLN
jgi:hypothetical protein